jgi:G:T/U-mismatch repair DNA glycosylase
MPNHNTELRIHPYNHQHAVPDGTRLLIIGTAPPFRFDHPRADDWKLEKEDVDFYYGSKDNQLWKILGKIYACDLTRPSPDECRNARQEFLRAHHMWMVDVLDTYTRETTSASDGDIAYRTYTKFGPIFAQHPSIDTVVFTGGTPMRWTRAALVAESLILAADFKLESGVPQSRRLVVTINADQRPVQFCTLSSPSTRNTDTLEKKVGEWGRVLLERCPASQESRATTRTNR